MAIHPVKGKLNRRSSSRRGFLRAAVVASAGSAALAVPGVARSIGPIVVRCQSAWPKNDPFYEEGLEFAQRLNGMTGGDLSMELLPVGSVAQASGLLESVAKGAVDAAHGTLAHHFHRHPAFGLWGSGPAFGMDANQLLAWHKYGGGKDLLEKLHAELGARVVSFLYGPMPTQPLGWFKKRVTRPGDLKGLRYRATGMAVELFANMGASVNPLPAEQIVSAMELGLLDGAEHNNVTSDRALGLSKVAPVCMLQSFHQNAQQFEFLVNRDKFEALPSKLKATIQSAVEAASQDMLWRAFDRYSRDYEELSASGKVNFFPTPAAILRQQLESYDAVAKKRSASPLFREIQASQKAFARRVVRWDLATTVDRDLAYNHYFRKPTRRKSGKK